MVVRKRLEKSEDQNIDIDQLRDELISKGGHVTSDLVSDKPKKTKDSFCLKMKTEMSQQIEKALESRVGISKTGWIIEAIHEKLKKEQQ